ncbi:hypothetical protein GBAR_LOCUS18692 [Geodia barretti]|nr:hypothetical protein GBAR_LOCUS18692 [Geodia barretti]
MQTVTTPAVIENAFRLYLHLPLPPLPTPDPRAISHIIIDRLRLTECFKRLVDRAMATVYLPLGFTGRRLDLECAAVIIIMLRILYGLDDRVELEECLTDASGHDDLTTDNSLPIWVDWVQVYCTRISSTSSLDDDAPPNLIDPRSSKSCQHYLKFCKDVVFSKCRSAPVPGSKSVQRFEPAFSRKISTIFASVSKLQSATEDAKLTLPADPPSPLPASDPRSTDNTTDNYTPRLVHVSRFIENPKAPCTTYRPLPTSHKWYEDLEETRLSHSMRFLISSVCEIIDTTPKSLYTVLLAVDMAFVEGISVTLRNSCSRFPVRKVILSLVKI